MIVHLDADAFFASVEQAADPKLRGRPVAVGGSARGVVASASYEARRLGIYTTMPTARARKICPSLQIVSGNFEQYERFSQLMFSYAYDHTPEVEIASIDEGYFDLRGNHKMPARDIAAIIRRAIAQSLRISVSEGIASNKLVSAVASKLKKPSCFLEVAKGGEKEFLSPLESKWLPGVGPGLARTFQQAGLTRIGQIAQVAPEQLSLFAGKGARQLWEFAHGIDERRVRTESADAKSYGEQETFDQDVTDEDWILAKLRSIADRLMAKVRSDHKAIRTVEVRVRYNDFADCRRSESLLEPTDLETDIYPLLRRLLKKAWERRVSLRLVSVKVSGVYAGVFQAGLPLLDAGVDSAQRRRLSPILDKIKDRYGADSVMRGHDLFLQRYRRKEELVASKSVSIKSSSAQVIPWAPLNFKSYYSFMDSLLTPKDIVKLAKAHKFTAAAVTDPNLHNAVEFFIALREAGIKPIIAAEIMERGQPTLAYVRNKKGYKNLCAILSTPTREILPAQYDGLILRPANWLPEIRYADPTERPMFNLLQSIRTLSLADEKTPEKRQGRFHFPSAAELAPYNAALKDSLEIADACEFAFDFVFEDGDLRFPRQKIWHGQTETHFLHHLVEQGIQRRYGATEHLAEVRKQVEKELQIIAQVGYESYFLLVWEILQDCKIRGIEWITRGSAADSLVCYCLGISDVCPVRFGLSFERFLNPERMALKKLPDIDIDFAHDRKDDVVNIIFEKYGEQAAIVGGFSTYRGRSAFADIAKAMGVSEFQVRRMTEHLPWSNSTHVAEAVAESQECQDLDFSEDPYQTAIRLADRLHGFPKNPKMHPCGIVLADPCVKEFTPVFQSAKGYDTTHLDMEQVEAIGLVKMDILAQGGLAVMRDTKMLLEKRGISVDLKSLDPWDDPEVWKMIGSGQARGVHHIESPAMTTLEQMVNVDDIDNLIAIVSVIRPGGANNLKKDQFADRAQGFEKPDYTHDSLRDVLFTTYGVIAYEEHILQICEVFAGLPLGRADVLRRALIKSQQDIVDQIGVEFAAAAREKKQREEKDIAAVWKLLNGFQGYAFCRAHSTAYGLEAYEAAWLKRYYPAEFLACVLTSGKGFYSRLVYTIECRRLGLGFLSPDVNHSSDHYYLPEGESIRVPLCQIKGLSVRTLERWMGGKPYASLRDFYLRVGPSSDEMSALIHVGAFDEMEPSRVRQFWHFQELAQYPTPGEQGLLLAGNHQPTLPDVPLEEPALLDRLRAESELLGFTVSAHPLALHPDIKWDCYTQIGRLKEHHDEQVTIAGMIIEDRIHRQEDGRLMKFISVCDATGIIECELFADAYKKFGLQTVRYPVVEITGRVMPFRNKNGHTLRVYKIACARSREPVSQ